MFLILATLLSLNATPAQAGTQLYIDHHYAVDTDLSGEPKECRREKGRLNGTYCEVPVKDSVKLTEAEGALRVEVETIGTDLDSCNFSGKAERISRHKIIAKDATEDCRIEITVRGGFASVEQLGGEGCEQLCGMHAGLYIERARRYK